MLWPISIPYDMAFRKGTELFIVSNEIFLKDYIEFFHGNTCRSFAGRSGQRQEIVLDPRCAEEHTLIHEVTFLEETLSDYGVIMKLYRGRIILYDL